MATETYCTGCNYDHKPTDCAYGMSDEEYEATLQAQDWYVDALNNGEL